MAVMGEVRPSQLMFTFGIGATLDLPEFSALVLGLDFWKKDLCTPVSESRLRPAPCRAAAPGAAPAPRTGWRYGTARGRRACRAVPALDALHGLRVHGLAGRRTV